MKSDLVTSQYEITPMELSLSESSLHLMYLDMQMTTLESDSQEWDKEAIEYVYESWLNLLKFKQSI